jgi:hypothetical protein
MDSGSGSAAGVLEKFLAPSNSPPTINQIRFVFAIDFTTRTSTMKVITVNFLACAVKTCRGSPAASPLHFKDAELEQEELDFNPSLVRNILPRIDWDSLRVTAHEVSILYIIRCPRASFENFS